MIETNTDICKFCYPLVVGAEAVCNFHVARAEITKLKSQLEEARAALKTFADALRRLESEMGKGDDSISLVLAGTGISESDLRQARSVLDAHKEGGKS